MYIIFGAFHPASRSGRKLNKSKAVVVSILVEWKNMGYTIQSHFLQKHLLLWSNGVKRSIFQKVIDVVVVDFDVGHEDGVATVFVHTL